MTKASSAMSMANHDSRVSHRSVVETGVNISSSARSINEKDSFVNSATKFNQSNSKMNSHSKGPVVKNYMKNGYINEVEALRGVFFAFFHARKQEGKVGRKRNDLLKMDFDEVTLNPFYNDELRNFDENFLSGDESPNKKTATA